MWAISVVVIIVTLFIGASFALQGENLSMLFGKQQADILTGSGDDIVAVINGENITKKGFETYKLFVNNGESKLTDRQTLDSILEQKVLFDEATQKGLSATDEEVAKLIESTQDIMRENEERFSAFKDYLNGLNMSEDQYWDSVKPAYNKFITCGKLKSALKEKFAEDNNILDKTELDTKFRNYYSQYVKELEREATIETDIK